MATTVQQCRRTEIWSNWACNEGERIAVITERSGLSAFESVSGDDKLILSVPVDSSAAAELLAGRIVRLDQDDSTFDEWKIVNDLSSVPGNLKSVECFPFQVTDFARVGLAHRTLPDGTVLYDFEVVGKTVAEHIEEYVIPLFVAAGMTWVGIGTIEPTEIIPAFTYQWSTPLAVLQRLAAATKCEAEVRRDGSDGQLIDVVAQIGADAPVADLRSRKNLLGLSVNKSGIEQANRIYPKGGEFEGESATMSRASWSVASVAGDVVTLEDPDGGDGPILADGQLAGSAPAYLRKPDGVLTEVTASSADDQSVTVADATGLNIGDLIQFRADSAGTDLTYLDHPDTIDDGVLVGVIELPDIPPTNNLVPNAACKAWSGADSVPPDGWAVVGSPAIDRETSAPYTEVGGNAVHVTTSVDGEGLRAPSAPLSPTLESQHASGYFGVWVVSGRVRVELIVELGGSLEVVYPPTGEGEVATNSVSGQMVPLGVAGINVYGIPPFLMTTEGAYLRIVQDGDEPAEFYVDYAQVTQSASQQPFVDGSGGTKLWQAANAKLAKSWAPIINFEISFADLARIDPATFGDDSTVVKGGSIRITEPRLSIGIVTRAIQIERNYLVPGESKVTLSNELQGLTNPFGISEGTVRKVPKATTQIIPTGPGSGIILRTIRTSEIGVPVPAGVWGYIIVPWTILPTEWWLLADQDSTVELNLWLGSYPDFETITDANSILNGNPIEIAGARKNSSVTLQGDWDPTTIPARSILFVEVVANDAAEIIELGLWFDVSPI